MVRGVAAYHFDSAAPPAILNRALVYEKWGLDRATMPAREFANANAAVRVNAVFQAYMSAAAQNASAKWAKENPKAWDFVSAEIARRRGIKNG